MTKIILITLALILSNSSLAANSQCSVLLAGLEAKPYDSLPEGLRSYRTTEVAHLTAEQVQKLNADAIKRVNDFVPPLNDNRARAITVSDAQKLIMASRNSNVTRFESRDKYKQEQADIGFCFGRATFMHLLLLKMGVQKESILKAWVVGPQQTPGIMWDFHVATLAFVKDKGWMVIDPNLLEPQTLQAWYDRSNAQSTDKKMRIYITEPNKFGVDAGKYTRVQMGLDLNRETDWYKNYFVDMMKSIGQKTPESLGLRHVPPDKASRTNPLQALRDFFTN
jgi:hypothetical protein